MERKASPSRRGFLWGAAATGAAATAVVTLPQGQPAAPEPAAQAAQPAPERGGGYHLTEHVRQYYKTTLI